MKHHELRKFPITPNQMRLPRLRQTVRRLVERPMANPRQIRRTRENGQRQTLLHKPPRHHAQPHSGRLIPSTRQYAKRLAHLGRRIHVPNIRTMHPHHSQRIGKSHARQPTPQRTCRKKCALALFRTDTNWAENNPTKHEVLDLWEQQMPCIQEQFLKRAYTVLHEALLVEFPNMRE